MVDDITSQQHVFDGNLNSCISITSTCAIRSMVIFNWVSQHRNYDYIPLGCKWWLYVLHINKKQALIKTYKASTMKKHKINLIWRTYRTDHPYWKIINNSLTIVVFTYSNKKNKFNEKRKPAEQHSWNIMCPFLLFHLTSKWLHIHPTQRLTLNHFFLFSEESQSFIFMVNRPFLQFITRSSSRKRKWKSVGVTPVSAQLPLILRINCRST